MTYLLLIIFILICFLCKHKHKHKRKIKKILFNIKYLDTHKILRGVTEMILTDLQKVKVSIAPVDAKGNPAKVDGIPTWESSDIALLTVIPADDGMSAYAFATGPLGTAQISVQVDADLGEGVKLLVGTLDIEIIASDAVSLSIAAGTPELI
jgi:hypothetical protein